MRQLLFFMGKSLCFNFRLNTANILGVRKLRTFKIHVCHKIAHELMLSVKIKSGFFILIIHSLHG